jgi:YegS/Rv2252/BmrU family lipid kinase
LPPSADNQAKRALLLLNQRASRTEAAARDALNVLTAGGCDLISPDLPQGCDCSALIREHAAQVDMVIVGGGDGSLHAAAPALVETGLPLGVLPLGTANDFARTIGLPASPAEAARVILAGQTRRMDLGEVNGELFFNVASVGFSAKLARGLSAEAKKRWGTLGYALAALRTLRDSRPFRVEIEHDGGRQVVRTLQVSVGNGRHHGGGMTVSEHARADDGKLDVYSLEAPHWWNLVALTPALRRGTQGRSKHVRAFETTALTLRTRRPRSINADGELVTTTPAHFRVHHKAISVFVPAGSGLDRQT